MKLNTFLIALLILLVSCKNEQNTDVKPSTESVPANQESSSQAADQSAPMASPDGKAANANPTAVAPTAPPVTQNGKPSEYGQSVYTNSSLLPIAEPCALVNQDYLESVFGKLIQFSVKPGNTRGKEAAKSCFFRWVTDAKPNAGILIQIMNNSVSDEVPNWPTVFIQSKLTDGEQQAYSDKRYTYKPFNELGNGGAYSQELGKYHWRLGDDYVFLLAFNTDLSADKQYKAAVKIGKEVMKNYQANIKK